MREMREGGSDRSFATALRVIVVLGPPAAAVGIALAVSAVMVAVAGGDPLLALGALGDGAFGSLDSLSEVGVNTCPLLLSGLAVAVAFRTGIWNVGAEGQLLGGAMATAWLGTALPSVPVWLGVPLVLLASAAAGGLWAACAALLKVRRGVDEVISTIMLNFIALALLSYLVHGPLQEASGAYPQSDPIVATVRLPRLLPSFRIHAGLPVAVAVTVAVAILLSRSVLGYEMGIVGGNREAARLAGIRVDRTLLAAFVLSGALAGLAGGVEVSGVTYRLYERLSPGYGFTGIAVALLGCLRPGGVAIAALFFGALEAGSNAMQRVAGVSSVLVLVIQAIVILVLIAFERRAWLELRWRPAETNRSTGGEPEP